jgi:hypothetical protein
MIARCAVCARLEAGDERVELLPAMFVHRGHCLARWLRAKPPQRVAWTARAERWIGPLTISRKFPFCPRPGRPPDTDRRASGPPPRGEPGYGEVLWSNRPDAA